MRMDMLIIADDLTGASDTGVQLAAKGWRTRVILDPESAEAEEAAGNADVVVIDTDSRAAGAKEAYGIVRDAFRKLRGRRPLFCYKKVDSTLRGNLGAEIDALLDEGDFDFAAVAPAFPKIGRTTVNGVHYVHGKPVRETEAGRDPKTPVNESVLACLLEAQSSRKAGGVPLGLIRSGPDAVRRKIRQLLAEDRPLVVFDAETDEDLARIIEAAAEAGRVLWVGSAGLAEVLAGRLDATRRGPAADAGIRPSGKPVLLVAGSLSRVTREQVETYARAPGTVLVRLDPRAAAASGAAWQAEVAACAARTAAALRSGCDTALAAGTSPAEAEAARAAGEARGLRGTAVSGLIAEALGEAAARAIRGVPLQGLILTGGDTAKAVCRRLGVHGVRLLRELEPGVPLGRLSGPDEIYAVTKAGAFGTPETLIKAKRALKGEMDS